jgi:hypothetical protein
MACITKLEEDTKNNIWVGTSARTGESKVFNTLDDYTRYTESLQTHGTYCADVEPKYNIKYHAGENKTPTGFLEFRPRDASTQSKYDAMQASWQGVESSEQAVARGVYSLDSAETTTRELRGEMPTPPKAKATKEDWCSIQ